jgi:hypothetical protein
MLRGQIALPANTRGGAFKTPAGKTILALWATGTDENATASYSIAASGAVIAYAWDYATTNATKSIAAPGGQAAVTLTSTPQFFALP